MRLGDKIMTLNDFVKTYYISDKGSKIRANDIYLLYLEYCQYWNFDVLGKNTFYVKLGKILKHDKINNDLYFFDLKLIDTDHYPMTDVMIDLSTTGLTPNSGIISIGAIKFNTKITRSPRNSFYMELDWENQGRHISKDTMEYWGNQDRATKLTLEGMEDLKDALIDLSDFIPSGSKIWANGTTLDINLLEHAYRQYNMEPPWKPWDIMELRTVLELFEAKRGGLRKTAHKSTGNALTNAANQTVELCNMYRNLTCLEPLVSKIQTEELVGFVDDNIEIGAKNDFLGYGADVFLVYKNWCLDNSIKNPLGRNTFYDKLVDHSITKIMKNKQVALFGGKLNKNYNLHSTSSDV